MTSSKDMMRSTSQSRNSLGASPASVAARPAHNRAHAHSMSLGSVSANRVSRRKSMTQTNVNPAAVMAAVLSENPTDGFEPTSLPGKHNSAVIDGPSLSAMLEGKDVKARTRRASDGSRLIKGEGKKGQPGDLKCDKCGKAYKHSSCLSKHMWEHTPEWALTSKLLISKHQQVQLLEAASVLVLMNNDQTPAGTALPPSPELELALSAHSSASPPGIPSSSDDEDVSSVGTTPPPQLDESTFRPQRGIVPRHDSSSTTYSRSYQSSVFSASMPNNYGDIPANSSRPLSAITTATSYTGSYHAEEDQDFAAAMSGLKFNTPKTGPTLLGDDVPPVPEIPAHFARSQNGRRDESFVRGEGKLMLRDTDMDVENSRHVRHRSWEHDEGVFGAMEE